jgi:biopolymer transport protein ExbB
MWIEQLVQWWTGGGIFMPLMLVTSLVLYGMIGERWWVLYGPRSHAMARRDELSAILGRSPRAGATGVSYDWAKRYLMIAEEAELSSGFAVIRALTMSLPLLGLLGTVTGMVATFASLAQGPGSETARHASAGIGVALSATQYGMGLAIPAMLGEWVLRKRVQSIVQIRDAALATAVPGDGPQASTAAVTSPARSAQP